MSFPRVAGSVVQAVLRNQVSTLRIDDSSPACGIRLRLQVSSPHPVPIRGDKKMMKIRSRAPLRLGLAGGRTDVSPYCDEFGGAILNATIGHYAYASIEPLTSGMVEFVSRDQDRTVEYDFEPKLRADGSLDLLKHVHNFAVRRFNAGKALNLRLTTRVDVPAGSALGGSSTMVVAALKAYSE